ncbi:MAG TPA: hypothetical protein V6D22_09575 [Candidatus Obscuribacterales bacterium]
MSSEPERDKSSRPDLHLVPNPVCTPGDVLCHFNSLIVALADVQMQDAELRQLWLETHWLKSDFEQNVLSMPTNWELMILQIARGQISANLKRYPKIVGAAADLGNAIKNHLRQNKGR